MNLVCCSRVHHLVAIAVAFSLLLDSISCYTHPRENEYWKRLQPRVGNNIRLRNFAETVWNIDQGNAAPNKAEIAEGQKCDAPFPGLVPVRPFHNPRDLYGGRGWMEHITSEYKIVQDELLQYLDRDIHASKVKSSPSDDANGEAWKTSTTNLCNETTGFTTLMLQNVDGTGTRIGRAYFPRTLHILNAGGDDSDDDVGSAVLAPRPVCINCQRPNTGLAPHSDNMNFLLTCHVALIVPQDGVCLFRNFDQERKWSQGEMVIADTSFVHSTVNTSPSESRYVLSFSIWHPHLIEEERHGILAIHNVLTSMEEVTT